MEFDTRETRTPEFRWCDCEFFVGTDDSVQSLVEQGHRILRVPLTNYKLHAIFRRKHGEQTHAEDTETDDAETEDKVIITDSRPLVDTLITALKELKELKPKHKLLEIIDPETSPEQARLPSEITFKDACNYDSPKLYILTAPGVDVYVDKAKQPDTLISEHLIDISVPTFICARINTGLLQDENKVLKCLTSLQGIFAYIVERSVDFAKLTPDSPKADDFWVEYFKNSSEVYDRITRDHENLISPFVRYRFDIDRGRTISDDRFREQLTRPRRFANIISRHAEPPDSIDSEKDGPRSEDIAAQVLELHRLRPAAGSKLVLTHYCDLDTVWAMLNSAKDDSKRSNPGLRLWATPVNLLNDEMEGQELFKWIEKALSKNQGASKLSNYLQWIREPPGTNSRGLITVTTSFSLEDSFEEAGDNLDMWRAYGGNNGVALTMELDHGFDELSQLYAVKYADDEFARTWALLQRECVSCPKEVEGHPDSFWMNLEMLRFCYKHPRWQTEREARIIRPVTINELRSVEGCQDGDASKARFFEPSEPFFMRRSVTNRTKVTLGPLLSQNKIGRHRVALRVRKIFQETLGYEPYVDFSKTKYRLTQ
ncbi:DUF2971 domain-containing protein [Haloferula helveola]|uniref:DUF2971 domain-containing protein n=2 Tax=Haloferula helveola TaxID=490095 RepID=A0ABM7RDN4_9BACT|nr:DUF2971 domain-containing protein [Haloferula helveola]